MSFRIKLRFLVATGWIVFARRPSPDFTWTLQMPESSNQYRKLKTKAKNGRTYGDLAKYLLMPDYDVKKHPLKKVLLRT